MPRPTSSGAPTEEVGATSVVMLVEPSGGIPEVVEDQTALARTITAFRDGSGPVAVDAERASGYRYGQRTYLLQLRRHGSGTALIDPIALPDLTALNAALAGVEWILHAASQDLPGLAPLGLVPDRIFDTELAARLLGMERAGLASVAAELLGIGLAKEHSAVDWSTRPLPPEWLRYAALDVEILIELRAELADRLQRAGKAEWAEQEFEAVRVAPPPTPRAEPWRRTSGLHSVRTSRGLAVVRALWQARDAEARSRDISPGRVLPDTAIIAAATALPASVAALTELKGFSGRATRRKAQYWFAAVAEALALPRGELPSPRAPGGNGPPAPRTWSDRNPSAAARLDRARAAIRTIAARVTVPTENLLQPDLVRRLAWQPPEPTTTEAVAEYLADGGARPWQVELTATALAAAATDQ